MTTGFYNLAGELEKIAVEKPFMPGIIFPAGRLNGKGQFIQYSFQQLNQRVDQYAHGFTQFGIKRGDRTLVMLKPGVELISSVFALMKMGAVPILIDPGMGRKAFLQCVSETEPRIMIGIPLAHLIKRIFSRPFRTITQNIVHGLPIFGGTRLKSLLKQTDTPFPTVETRLDEEAAVAFTSGGTGIPKGVVYQNGMFKAQINAIKTDLKIKQGDIHLAAIYIFALFNPALGVTTVIPDMDPRKTEALNPERLVEAIQTFGVTFSLGSPTVWRIVGSYCVLHGITLPSVKNIFMFGAPVYPELLEQFSNLIPNGTIGTPYGATEALPLTNIDAGEILAETAASTRSGKGVCVGKPVAGISIRIIKITDQPIPKMTDEIICRPEEIGEITVQGDMITKNYLNRPEKTKEAKIHHNRGIWHRIGDLGYLDKKGRVWVCGRKSHRVETETSTLLPICCEPIFNKHPKVFRTALVGVPDQQFQKPVLIVELENRMSKTGFEQVKQELLSMGNEFPHTKEIKTILKYNKFPVDVRHNAKIQREQLAKWAEKQL